MDIYNSFLMNYSTSGLKSFIYDFLDPRREDPIKYLEAYSEPCQLSKMERFAKIVDGFYLLTISAKRSILDV